MHKSKHCRVADSLAVMRLVGECRDLGDDHDAWRSHLLAGLADLIDSEFGCTGEMGGCLSLDLKDLGVVYWWRDRSLWPNPLDDEAMAFIRDPNNWPAQGRYHLASRDDVGACLTRRDIIDDEEWKSVSDYRLCLEMMAIDHRLWCFRPIPGGVDEHVGSIFYRVEGRRDFSPRDRTVVGLATELIAPLVGGPLARFAEPSPRDLGPQVRRVLRCLLDGDSDKQVAVRLGISRYTVNQYTKVIYKHFGTNGRAELMARWVRRGWGASCGWAD